METNGTVEVFLDPNSLDRDVGDYVFIGLEGGSSANNSFSLNSTSGDRRSKLIWILSSLDYNLFFLSPSSDSY